MSSSANQSSASRYNWPRTPNSFRTSAWLPSTASSHAEQVPSSQPVDHHHPNIVISVHCECPLLTESFTDANLDDW